MPSKTPRRPDRGEIRIADLNPRRGTEPGKRRPVLVVQARALLRADHPSTIVIPLTTRLVEDAAPLRLRVPARGTLARPSDLLVDQMRAIDNRRLTRGPVLRLSADQMRRVDSALRDVLDLHG